MSTKIYTAWKFPVKRLNEFLEIFDKKVWYYVVKEARIIIAGISSEQVQKKIKEWKVKEIKPGLEQRVRFSIFDRMILDDRLKPEDFSRHLIFRVGVNLWLKGNYAYACPWGHEKYYYKIKFPVWVKDFAYWNNVDPPRNVSSKEWNHREQVWEDLCLGKVQWWNRGRLIHHAVDLKEDYVHGIMKLKDLVLGKYGKGYL